MSSLNQLILPSTKHPQSVEIDPPSHSVYIRFSNAKVHKTLSDDRQGAILAVDLDSRNQIIGVELVGVGSLTLSEIRSKLPPNLKNIDFERARWMPAGMAGSAEPVSA